MRLNRYLASTLFAGLFVTASFLSPAMGQEQALQPQGAWAITKIDKSTQGGNSYCTLSRKYDNGVVLSLGRNQAEEYSLAIDFQKQVFTKDKSLKINLQPGPGQIRAYDLMPASEKAVVVRLGWDAGFFGALNKSQQMKVKIADKNYAFAMPEIAKGQDDLEECMEGLQAAAKGSKDGDKTAASNNKDVLNADPKASKEFDAAKSDEKLAVAPAPKDASVKAEEESMPKAGAVAKNDEDAPKRRNFASKSSAEDDAKVAAPKEEKVAELPRRESGDAAIAVDVHDAALVDHQDVAGMAALHGLQRAQHRRFLRLADRDELERRRRADDLGATVPERVDAERLPVVAITAHGELHRPERTLGAGFRAHVRKPIDPWELCRVLVSVTRRS